MAEKIVEEVVKNKEIQNNLANLVQNEMLTKLEDIDWIDSINPFPLAPGWWIIIIILTVLISKALVSYVRWLIFKRSYQGEVYYQLVAMQKNLNNITAHKIALKLSELLRRLVMFENSRLECASLEGEDWLKWLREHDKNNFNWVEKGKILTQGIYAPPGQENITLKDLHSLIDATKKWVV